MANRKRGLSLARDKKGPKLSGWVKAHPFGTSAAVGIAALTGCAIVNQRLAKDAEERTPPIGRFLDIEGVRLHYIDRGQGDALLMLHGNGSMIQDFESSGLVALAAKRYRVIVFDRPGYGYTERPRGTLWSPDAQATLIHRALQQLGVQRVTVLGHSWGTFVAIALALKDPELVTALVLASGYYYPTARGDVPALSIPSIPIIGDLMSLTLAPATSRAMWSVGLAKMFGPQAVPSKFSGFPKEMALRPSSIRAAAEESALIIPSAFAHQRAYHCLKMPVVIVAGVEDRVVDVKHSAWLHGQIARSIFRPLSGAGHMVHQTETLELMAAISASA